ncbi:COG3904 family protein [Methylovirgula sp. 4M-Z18]|uniref:COG3904 family protein n=1 Tax=Methylovirgula sp. 4M-Z18 TaxID=2293567 RepID=UPI0011C0425E|nr:hypothetical protein [Methylovirgula sp. 4M-Z18]
MITTDTPGEFARVFQAMGNARLPIVIQSPGGEVHAALEIGRMIRRRGLDIAVGLTRFSDCGPSDATCAKRPGFAGYRGAVSSGTAYCASACPLVFAGGVKRDAGRSAFVGVHQIIRYLIHYRQGPDGHSVEVSRDATGQTQWTDGPEAQTSVAQYQELATYFRQMGVDDGVVPLMLKTPNASMHWMSRAELFDTLLATDSTDASEWVANFGHDPIVVRYAPHDVYHAPPAVYHAPPHDSTIPPAHAALPMAHGPDGQTPSQAQTPTHANVVSRDGGTSPRPLPDAAPAKRRVPATPKSLDASDSQRLW